MEGVEAHHFVCGLVVAYLETFCEWGLMGQFWHPAVLLLAVSCGPSISEGAGLLTQPAWHVWALWKSQALCSEASVMDVFSLPYFTFIPIPPH